MGRDKALLEYRGSTFLNHLISVFAPRVAPLVVVLGHHAEDILATIQEPQVVKIVVNENYRMGMVTSLQAGIRAIPSEVDAAMFGLVDHPTVKESTIDLLVEQFQGGQRILAIPCYQNQRGHPVIATRSILEKILHLQNYSTPKTVIRKHSSDTTLVEVDDPGVVLDIDEPGDYESVAQF